MIDIILSIAQIIFGLFFFLYLPGSFVVEIFFSKLKQLEKLLLSSLFSIMIGMSIGVFFGYDRVQAIRTGGFTGDNIWVAELLLTALLAFILILKRNISRHPVFGNQKGESKHIKSLKNHKSRTSNK